MRKRDSLAALQRAVLARLYAPESADMAEVCSDVISATQRLDIYRNNLRANFHNVMALEFPVLLQLCGVDYFRQLTGAFQDAHPSRRGNLHHIGEAFAGWLALQLTDTDFRWFADMAAVEWAWQECYVAAEPAGTADLARLARLTADGQQSLRFKLTPACRILRSRWPVLSVWQAHQRLDADGGASLEDIDMSQAENLLIYRRLQGVLVQKLGDGEAVLLQRLAAGEKLGEALERALLADAGLDPVAALQRAAQAGLFIDLLVEDLIAQRP